MELGTRIAAWRKARKLQVQEFAAQVGVTPGAVCHWEAGKSSPTQANLAAIVKVLGVTLARFYGQVPKARAA